MRNMRTQRLFCNAVCRFFGNVGFLLRRVLLRFVEQGFVYVGKRVRFVFQTRRVFFAHFLRRSVVGHKKIHNSPLRQYIDFLRKNVNMPPFWQREMPQSNCGIRCKFSVNARQLSRFAHGNRNFRGERQGA